MYCQVFCDIHFTILSWLQWTLQYCMASIHVAVCLCFCHYDYFDVLLKMLPLPGNRFFLFFGMVTCVHYLLRHLPTRHFLLHFSDARLRI